MKTQDLEKVRELEQEQKETRFLMAEAHIDRGAAVETVKALTLDVSHGRPGARVELDAAKEELGKIEERAKLLDERNLSLVKQSGELGKWDLQARNLARENSLSEEQMEHLFELLKSGKSREQVQKVAARLSATGSRAAPSESFYSFQGAGDVPW